MFCVAREPFEYRRLILIHDVKKESKLRQGIVVRDVFYRFKR
ncbi:hypothetical protein SCG7109_AC_00230 [Chlamydiales bacterium SCGC AG-110-M15]|nr:hypothetical protein SCG7109_AC_00230 [Chlamydiales bacterium SCGC AG-110-M15]